MSRGRTSKRIRRGHPIGAPRSTMEALWLALVECLVEVVNQPHGVTAQELEVLRKFLAQEGIQASSLAAARGHLSKLAAAALAAPFELKQTGSSLGARHDDGNDDGSTS